MLLMGYGCGTGHLHMFIQELFEILAGTSSTLHYQIKRVVMEYHLLEWSPKRAPVLSPLTRESDRGEKR